MQFMQLLLSALLGLKVRSPVKNLSSPAAHSYACNNRRSRHAVYIVASVRCVVSSSDGQGSSLPNVSIDISAAGQFD